MTSYETQPTFHLYLPQGWVNDPNGPLYYAPGGDDSKGRYHMFYQSVTDSTKWTWGLAWGHAASADLIHWRHLPPALVPTPGGPDADGCFSGCATVDPSDGRPAILYTGVVRKPDAADREGMPLTCSTLSHERQLLAKADDPDDPDLLCWTKDAAPWVAAPPPGMKINCFRDPFVLERPSGANGCWWRVMVGSCLEVVPGDACCSVSKTCNCQTLGTALVYCSKDLHSGWEYDGLLCVAGPGEGGIWECPIMARLAPDPPDEAPSPSNSGSASAAQPTTSSTAPGTEPGDTGDTHPTSSTTAAGLSQGLDATATGPGEQAADAAAAGAPQLAPISLRPHPQHHSQQQQQQQQQLFGSSQYNHHQQPHHYHHYEGERPPLDLPQLLAQQHTHMFSVSVGVCPAIYWLGRYRGGKFDLVNAEGPYALDLGDVVYAPNLMVDKQGRQLIWAWLQEHPNPGGAHDYAGCISTPRALSLEGGRLVQAPLPELEGLRSGRGLRLRGIPLPHGKAWSIPDHICASHLDLTLKLAPHGAKRVQLVLGPLLQHHQVPEPGDTLPPGDDTSATNTATGAANRVLNREPSSGWLATVQAAAVTYEFDTCQLQVLVGPPADVEDALKQQNKPFAKAPGQPGGMAAPPSVRLATSLCEGCPMVGPQPMQMPATPAPPEANPASPVRTLCCQLRGEPQEEVTLRLLLDYSILELFTGSGEVLTTRVYRGAPTARAAALAAKKEAALAAADAHAHQVGATMDGTLGEVGGLLHSSSLRSVSTSFSFTHLSGDGSDELASPQYRPGWLSPGSGATSPMGVGGGGGGAPSPGTSSSSPFRRSQSARSPRLRWGSPRLPTAAGSPRPPWLEGASGSSGAIEPEGEGAAAGGLPFTGFPSHTTLRDSSAFELGSVLPINDTIGASTPGTAGAAAGSSAGGDPVLSQQVAALTGQLAQTGVQEEKEGAGRSSSSTTSSITAAQLLSREAAAPPTTSSPPDAADVGSSDQGDKTPATATDSAGKKAPNSTPGVGAAAGTAAGAAGVGGVKGAALAWAEVSLMAVGGDALVTRLEAHEMGSMWA